MIAMISLPKVLNVLSLRGGEGGINPLFKFTFTIPKVKNSKTEFGYELLFVRDR